MQFNRITMTFIPFLTMILATLFSVGNIPNTNTTIYYPNQTANVNNQTASYSVLPITITSIATITIIIAVAVAICLAVGIHVLGSGISGSVIPIIFVVTILTAIYTLLSIMSFPMFASIPIFGIPIFFFLAIMYIVGLTGMAVPSGGE